LIGAKLEIATPAGGGCEVKLAVNTGPGTAGA
jgi:hypothetical protein